MQSLNDPTPPPLPPSPGHRAGDRDLTHIQRRVMRGHLTAHSLVGKGDSDGNLT